MNEALINENERLKHELKKTRRQLRKEAKGSDRNRNRNNDGNSTRTNRNGGNSVSHNADRSSPASVRRSKSKSAEGRETKAQEFEVEATAYTALCDTGCTGITATGVDVSSSIYHEGKRVIAVSPSQIPLGSTVEVIVGGQSFMAVAADTGGDIGYGRIDVLVGSYSEARKFGRKKAKVRVVK